MAVQRRYPEELRRRAVRLVLDARDEAGGRRGVCTRVGQQLGVPPDTLRGWVHRAEINEWARPGRTTDEHARLVALEWSWTRVLEKRSGGPLIGKRKPPW